MDYKGDIFYIEQILAGNSNVFRYIVDQYKDKAFNLALRICGNHEEAEEITQDSFLKAYRSLQRFEKRSSFATWLYRIVYNSSISNVRIKKKKILSLEDFPADAIDFIGNSSSDEEAEREYRNSLVNFALQKIKEEERALISLFYYEDMRIEEMSDITGISKSNIKVKLFRTRQKMLEIIEKVNNNKQIYHE